MVSSNLTFNLINLQGVKIKWKCRVGVYNIFKSSNLLPNMKWTNATLKKSVFPSQPLRLIP